MSGVVLIRACPVHGPQTEWVDVVEDLENPRSPRIASCVIPVARDELCGLELGRPREYVPLAAVLDAVRDAALDLSQKPRRLVELVEKRLRRTRRGART